MKKLIALWVIAASAAFAQQKAPGPFEPVPVLPVNGTLSIQYRSRTADGATKEGVTDQYTLNVMVANSAVFKGTILHLPPVRNTITRNQLGRVTYDMELEVVNPANPRQTRPVGKLFGFAPIDDRNVYRFSEGAGIKVAVFPIGQARGFESRFAGLALAKPPGKAGVLERAKQEAVRLVSGKGGAIVLTRYDKMEFQNLVLPAGPVQIYPETTVSGTLFYDYGRSAWHFNNVQFVYNSDGKRANDVLTGSIRWIEAKNRRQTGEGRYEFDIRVNEPPPTESQVFSAVADEAAFFSQDENVPSFTGAMSYKDTFIGTDTVSASMVSIDLKTTKLSKQQAMMLSKLIFLTATVPINAE